MIADQTGKAGEIPNKMPSGLPDHQDIGDKTEEVKNIINKGIGGENLDDVDIMLDLVSKFSSSFTRKTAVSAI